MAEIQVVQTLLVGGVPVPVDGGEVQTGDLALLGQTAGLADDRVLAELLRLAPFAGTVPVKAIEPHYFLANPLASLYPIPATVIPSGAGGGSVGVQRFRAIVGSRTPQATSSLDNWRDLRSAIFIPGPGASTLIVPLAANSSGNPRWDLVYATFTVDVPSNAVQRRVKDPSSSAVSVQAVYQGLAQTVTVSVVTGTPSATPAVPALPADAPPAYNIPLAAVRVPDGFTSSSTVAAGDIRDLAPCAPLAPSTGASTVRMASGNNDSQGAGAYQANFPWSTSAGERPPVFLPPSMVGGEELIVEINALTGSPSHPDGSVVDSSVDWRNRFFATVLQVRGSGTTFANDQNASPSPVLPSNVQRVGFSASAEAAQLASSFPFSPDNLGGAGDNTIAFANHLNAPFAGILGSGDIAIYCDSSGALRCHLSGTPQANLFAWIRASAPFPNP